MSNTITFYKEQIKELSKEATHLKKQLRSFVFLRLLVFLGTSFLVYVTLGSYPDVFIIAFLGIVLFSFLVIKFINLKKQKAIIDAKIDINNTEIKVLHRDFYHLETGEAFVNSAHEYSNDIDLFGKGSFFQYINRTATHNGRKVLANTLTENNIEAILEKQAAISELSEKVKWRQHFAALASLITVKNTTQSITGWIVSYTSLFPKFLGVVARVFSIVSLLLIGLLVIGKVAFGVLLVWFFIGLFTTVFYLKNIQQLYTKTSNVRETFRQYNVLLKEIENETFTAKILVEKQQLIQSETKLSSVIFKEFSKILDAFDQRNNILIALVGNGLFLWDIKNAAKVEKWISNYSHTVEKWFEVVAFFDAQNSFGNFKFNHSDFVLPEITERAVIKAINLGHPLLDAKKRVDNNFTIDDAQFFIITGANMAGKSTFLRTLSLSIVMSNCGLPVCAERFTYAPIKLITSMRTTDSLTEDASYFYSELKRLKFIVDEIKEEKYFIILDEILKGTNSKDKAIGSKKFVEKLSKSKSTGIIATHDVSLCALEEEFSAIKNYYFDAEIIHNELHFDYTLKNGVCKNMNASFLLQKMEIC